MASRASASLLLLGADEFTAVANLLLHFRAATCWSGPQHGWVFKTGHFGLGYYKDGTTDLEALTPFNALASCCTLIRVFLRPMILRHRLHYASTRPDWRLDAHELERLVSAAETTPIATAPEVRAARQRCDALLARLDVERPLRRVMSDCLKLELDQREGCFHAFAPVLVEHQIGSWDVLRALLREILWPGSMVGAAGAAGSTGRAAAVYAQLYAADRRLAMELWRAAREVVVTYVGE